MSYTDEANKISSEKIVLAHIEPSEQLVLFTLDSGAIYKRSVDHYVMNVKQDDTTLTEASSSSLSSGEWFFDADTKELYVRMSDDTNPQTKFVSVFYRLFFSNIPVIQSFDLSTTGKLVDYEGNISGLGQFTQSLDEEATGIAVETTSSIAFENNDGFWDDLYDTLFWENKTIKIYSWFRNQPFDENQILFQGVIENKSFSSSRVNFQIKDLLFKLREPLPLPLFSSSDGVSTDRIGTPKRRLYGSLEGILTTPTDIVGDGFSLTGTLAGSASSQTVTGTGTTFLSELSPGDEITIVLDFNSIIFSIESIESDTSLTLSESLDNSFSGRSATVKPVIPFREKNRTWHIAGHKLRSPSATIDTGIQENRFSVTDINDLEDFFANDLVLVDGEQNTIKRISGTQVTLFTNLQGGVPSTDMVKVPVSKVFFTAERNKGTEMVFSRDWTLTNGANDAFITFDDLAEFNVTKPSLLGGSISFTNGSRVVTTTNLDFKAENILPRDWIKLGLSDDPTHQVWYEVLQVDSETQLTLRVNFAGSTQTGTATEIKRVEYIDDNSLITVNTLGRENAAADWVKTGSDAVKDMLEDAGLTNDLNTTSFSDADIEAPYILSLALPLNLGGQSPKVRDAINLINDSIFGSLSNDINFKLFYRVLTPEKPTGINTLKDFDVIGTQSFSAQSRSDIFKKVIAKFKHFDADKFNGEAGSSFFEFENPFVTRLIESKAEQEIDVYLFNQADTKVIAQRFAFFHSLTSSTITIRTPLEFVTQSIGDKVFIQFDRLYKRFGQKSRQKIGVITSVSRSGEDIVFKINDLGNIFNRTGNITANTADIFTSADDDAKLFNGYIVDNSTALPDNTSEEAKGINLIG